MKKFASIYKVLVLVLLATAAQAQIKIGDNPGVISASALLELESTSKGFLLPRMTTAQRAAISAPAEGLMVYDTDIDCSYIFKSGTGWVSLCATASNGLTVTAANDVKLGGTLTENTTIVTSGNTLTITGNGTVAPLQLNGLLGGASTDSVLTVNAATGEVRKRTVADLLSDQNVAWKTKGNAGTDASINFIGTTDAVDFVTRTNNVERMRVTSAGAVGIGTTTPTAGTKLDIEGGNLRVENATSASATVTDGTTAGALTVASNATTVSSDGTSGLALNATAAAPVAISTNGSERMRVTSAGAVGIGTTTPTAGTLLDVDGGNFRVENATSASATVTDGTTAGALTVASNATTVSSDGTSGLALNATAAAPVAVSTNGSERMRVTSAGNVGIATTAPTSRFQVGGSVAMPISNKSSAYTVTDEDYTIVADCTTAGFTLTLPDPATCAGRMYVLIKGDASNNVLTFSRAISLSATQSMTSINYNVRLHIQSDGTNWWLIARF